MRTLIRSISRFSFSLEWRRIENSFLITNFWGLVSYIVEVCFVISEYWAVYSWYGFQKLNIATLILPSWIILKYCWEHFAWHTSSTVSSCSSAQGNNHYIFFHGRYFLAVLCAEFWKTELGQYKLHYFHSLQEICHSFNILSRFNKSFCIMLFENAFY